MFSKISHIYQMSYDHIKEKLNNKYPAISDLFQKAQKRIPHVAWEYLSSGTGDEDLLDRNRRDFQSIQFLPRFCKGELTADTSVELFGRTYSAPIGISPVGLTGLMWPRVENYLAAAANSVKIPYTLSTVATETPESVGEDVGDMGWFQLYPPRDFEMTKSLLKRASDSGFHTLFITADVPMASKRERTRRAGLAIPPKITPKMIWEGITHPTWAMQTVRRGLPRLRTVETYASNTDLKFVSGFVGNRLGGTLDWDYCQRVKEVWDGPVILKGVMHPADAEKCIEIGLDGIGVSNHGARQFNGTTSSISALPHIAKVVNGRVPIIFDGGVRTGLDIMRALYQGADFVMAGRPFVAAVAAVGQYGGDHAAHIFTDDLQNNMVQLGVAEVSGIREADVVSKYPNQ